MIYVGGAKASGVGFPGVTVDLTALSGGVESSAKEGDFVIFAIASANSSDRLSNMSVATPGYDLISGLSQPDTNVANMKVFTKFMSATPDTSISASGGTNNDGFTAIAHVWRGVDSIAPLDVAVVNAQGPSSSVPNPGAITPVTANSTVVVIGSNAFSLDKEITGVSTGYTNTIIEVSKPITGPDSSIGFGSKAWVSGEEDPGQFTTGGTATTNSWVAVTLALRAAVPVITTGAVTDIGLTTATANAEVVSGGGLTATQRGMCWSVSPNPTTADFKAITTGTLGAYSLPMGALTQNQTYYVRAYLINSAGTFYGNEVTFDTLALPSNQISLDINGVDGATYAVQLYVGGTTGAVTVKLGTTGYSQVVNAGAGVVVVQGVYGGVNGIIIEASNDFDGYIDHVNYVLILGDAPIDWNLNTLTNIFPINSSVAFKRIESKDFNTFVVYRYLDLQFKDLDAYVTVLLKNEANENMYESGKSFLVSSTSDDVLPFVKKRVSMLKKNQAMVIQLSNNRLNEKFTICRFIIKGFLQSNRQFDGDKIIGVV